MHPLHILPKKSETIGICSKYEVNQMFLALVKIRSNRLNEILLKVSFQKLINIRSSYPKQVLLNSQLYIQEKNIDLKISLKV